MSLQKYTKEWLEQLCAESRSYAEVLRKAGRAQAGGSQRTLKEKLKNGILIFPIFQGKDGEKRSCFKKSICLKICLEKTALTQVIKQLEDIY